MIKINGGDVSIVKKSFKFSVKYTLRNGGWHVRVVDIKTGAQECEWTPGDRQDARDLGDAIVNRMTAASAQAVTDVTLPL